MTAVFETNWHVVKRDLPAPYADCYLAVKYDIRDAIETALYWANKDSYFAVPTAVSGGYQHRVRAVEDIYEAFNDVRQNINYNWHSPRNGWDNMDEAAIKYYIIDTMYKWEVFS